MNGFKRNVVIMFCLFATSFVCRNVYYKSDNKIMEINEVIKSKSKLNNFIEENYELVMPFGQNPIFPYKINYKNKSKDITFCGIVPVDSWVLKQDSSYTFFLLLKDSGNVYNVIRETYGKHFMEAEGEVNDVSMGISYSWDLPPIEIYLRKFINVEHVAEYEDCYMAVIGNMKYTDIVILPDTTGLDLDEL